MGRLKMPRIDAIHNELWHSTENKNRNHNFVGQKLENNPRQQKKKLLNQKKKKADEKRAIE